MVFRRCPITRARYGLGLLALVCWLWSPAAVCAQKLEPPKKIKNVDPVYPATAQQARIQGEVAIEATVGIDGKVSDASVIASIPQLDDAALTAVRQWEYTPATVDGVPTAVKMTVKVKFALGAPVAARPPGPLVLDHDATDWTLNGTPLLDDNLTLRLQDVMRTEARKELYVHIPGTATYRECVRVLASATDAGVERLLLFVGTTDATAAIPVTLEEVPASPGGPRLPQVDKAPPTMTPDAIVSVPRAGAIAPARTAMQRVAAGKRVRLHIDESRPMSDVWQVLNVEAARRSGGVALAVRTSAPAAMPPQTQREWEQASRTISKLALPDSTSTDVAVKAIPILEKFVARNPDVADAQFMLAQMYETRSSTPDASGTAKRRDLESAAAHYAKAADLYADGEAGFLMKWKLVKLYGPDAINDPAQAEKYARRLASEHPSRTEAHMVYAQLLREKGDMAGAAEVMRKGRAVASMPPLAILMEAQYAIEYVQTQRSLPRETARTFLDEAILATDAALAAPDRTTQDYRLATLARAMALDLEAERVAQTRQERLALLLESERWGAPIENHKNGAPPPVRAVSATEADDLEWDATRRWNARLADEGGIAEAVAAIEQYAAGRPDLHAPHVELAALYERAADATTGGPARIAALEHAVSELQRVIDLAPTDADRTPAFARLMVLTGPRELDRPDRQETAARAMLKRQPDDPAAHCALAAVLLRTGRTADGEKALRTARARAKSSPSSRGALAGQMVGTVHTQKELPPAAARRLFDEADSLLSEAEKLKGGDNDIAVIEGRMAWLNLAAERFESDPARAAADRERAARLSARAIQLRQLRGK
jgi:TonB family protein